MVQFIIKRKKRITDLPALLNMRIRWYLGSLLEIYEIIQIILLQ